MELTNVESSASRSRLNKSHSLQKVIDVLKNYSSFTPSDIKSLLEKYPLSSNDLIPWADFQHSNSDSYGRQLVYDGGHFEVMVMSWVPGDMSAIHDHGSTQWGAVQCFGHAAHYTYEHKDNELICHQSKPYTPGMICTVDNNLIHQMGNEGDQPFVSLHIYGCTTAQNSITGDARIFDLFENTIQYTDGGVFFCLPESHINRRSVGPTASQQSTIRHHQQMASRIKRMLTVTSDGSLHERLRQIEAILAQLQAD